MRGWNAALISGSVGVPLYVGSSGPKPPDCQRTVLAPSSYRFRSAYAMETIAPIVPSANCPLASRAMRGSTSPLRSL